MELENRVVLVFTILGIFALIPFIAANYGNSGSGFQPTSPSGMIIGALDSSQNASTPYTRTSTSGPDSYTETIRTQLGEFTMTAKHDEIKYQFESNDKMLLITERADSKNEFFSTSGYTLNVTTVPTRLIEEFQTPEGWIRNVRESGVDSNTSACSNLTYMNILLSNARLEMLLMKNEMEMIKYGVSLPGSSNSGIYINEFLANPSANESSTEWIELYNNRTSNISIGGWILDDVPGGSEPYTIPAGTIIASKGFIVFFSNTTDIQLNNNGDSVRLLDSSGNVIDSVSYYSSIENVSIGRVPDSGSWVNLTAPTPGATND